MTPIRLQQSYAGLPERFYARINPEPASNPSLFSLNEPLATELGLDVEWLRSEQGIAMLSGRNMPEGVKPIAMAYAGHQFGSWVPQLGDGRAHLLGEVVGSDGSRFDLHLKGSGRTPFSRNGDGRAPLGPVLREYIVSEAMAGLNISTTRTLAATLTGDAVYREQPLPGAVLARVAKSHVRVGTFQYFHARDDLEAVKTLADYVIARHFPETATAENRYLALLEQVVSRQATLIARWMGVGFIHGVMNSDNMQVAGETIDFGPCAFMDSFDPDKRFSSIDRYGRYAWSRQPGIGRWNLARLAETLLPLIDSEQPRAIEKAEAAVYGFDSLYEAHFEKIFADKLGLAGENSAFIDATLKLLAEHAIDFTLFFRRLTQYATDGESSLVRDLFDAEGAADAWLSEWQQQRDRERTHALQRMRRSNPVYIPRNHRVEEAIAAAYAGDTVPFERLTALVARPFEAQQGCEAYELPPEPHEEVHYTFCGT